MEPGLLILHPRAQLNGRCSELLEHLKSRFELRIEESRFPGQTREHTRSLPHGFAGVVFTAGGDGTLHEAINGWGDKGFPKGPRFCPLPLGSGNDFLFSIDRRLANLDSFLSFPIGQQNTADLGRVSYQRNGGEESRYFCVGATTGFSAVVTERRAALARRVPGRLSYLLALFLSLAFWKNRAVRVESGESPQLSDIFFNFNAANVRHYGGGMVSAPGACPFDGTLNAVCMNLTLAQALLALPENFRGRFERVKNVHLQELREPFTVDCSPTCPVQADGELLGQTPMRVECLPGALPLALPTLPRGRTRPGLEA
ncbi:MAG: diacylglycerol kinase family protein [Vulcanimicrobiota bacterium]